VYQHQSRQPGRFIPKHSTEQYRYQNAFLGVVLLKSVGELMESPLFKEVLNSESKYKDLATFELTLGRKPLHLAVIDNSMVIFASNLHILRKSIDTYLGLEP